MAMERLTASPYILDIYSFCGQSALNEIAVDSVEKVARCEYFVFLHVKFYPD